jgi:hypothetical protein
VDILVFGDCARIAAPDPGSSCARLNDIRDLMYRALGGVDHYYFVDACRNTVDNMVVPPITGNFGQCELGSPEGVYTLYSAAARRARQDEQRFLRCLCSSRRASPDCRSLDLSIFSRSGATRASSIRSLRRRTSTLPV